MFSVGAPRDGHGENRHVQERLSVSTVASACHSRCRTPRANTTGNTYSGFWLSVPRQMRVPTTVLPAFARLRPVPHGCIFHPLRCVSSRCVHINAIYMCPGPRLLGRLELFQSQQKGNRTANGKWKRKLHQTNTKITGNLTWARRQNLSGNAPRITYST